MYKKYGVDYSDEYKVQICFLETKYKRSMIQSVHRTFEAKDFIIITII